MKNLNYKLFFLKRLQNFRLSNLYIPLHNIRNGNDFRKSVMLKDMTFIKQKGPDFNYSANQVKQMKTEKKMFDQRFNQHILESGFFGYGLIQSQKFYIL